jgi:CO/xanthine dehydrogenase Mo-binding subunit
MARETLERPQYRFVGRPLPRLDAPAKVTGRTQYGDDIKLPRLLHVKLVQAPVAHARIRGIDPSEALAVPGVVAVVTAADLPPHRSNPSNRSQVLLARDEVLFYGQPVAAVIAQDVHTAAYARDLVKVDYEELPALVDPLDAMREDAPPARISALKEVDRSEQRGHITADVQEQEQPKAANIASTMSFQRGDVAAGFAEADAVVEGTWRSAMVHQSYIEPHVITADYDAATGELSIWTSTQAPFFTRDEVAKTLGIPESKLRVTATEVGGGFGGKIYLYEALVGALAMVTRRAVRLTMNRKEDMLATTPAPQAVVNLKVGMKRDGTLTALQAQVIFDAGAFPGAPVMAGCLLIGGFYKCPNLDIQGYEVLTNKVSVGALRAPGAPNVAFAIESAMDMLAQQLELDPLEVRLKNAVEKGDQLPSGQPYPAIGLKECLEAIGQTELWQRRHETRQHPNRGVGIAVGGWLGGLQPASANVALNGDGTINVMVGAVDITGTNTTLAQIAAEVLNVPLSMVSVTTGDTKSAPYAGMSAGSKVTYVVGRAVKLAAEDARRQILEIAAQRLQVSPEELEMEDGVVRVKGEPDKQVTFRELGRMTTGFGVRYAPVLGRGNITARQQAPGFTAQAVEVEVDPDTGEVTVLRCAIAQDAGFAINPRSVEGQMQGGVSQGLGLALSEEMLYDEKGRLLNPNLLDYRLLTTRDLPPIETIIVEVPSEEGPFGARIVGEPSIVPGPAAVANAVADALGARVFEYPLTPERILRALGKVQD